MKSLRPHLYRYVPKYFAKKYPKYVSLMENFLIFLETKNSLNFFDGTTERDHSIYNNIIDFDKHAQIDNLPVKNKDILNAYFKEYATTLDFRNQILTFDEETLRMLAKFSEMIFNTKSSWSSYNLLFAIISTYLFNGAERGVIFKAYFNEDLTFDTEDAPDFYDIITVADISKFSYADFIKNGTGSYGFAKLIDTSSSQIYIDTYNGTFITGDALFNIDGVLLDAGITVDNSDSIGRNEIILSEYPLYKINIGFDGVEVDKNVITGKGTRPFEYQLISKSDLFVSGNFVSKLKSGFNPAGFKNEIIYVPEDIECDTYYDSKMFPKIKLYIDPYEPPDTQIVINGIDTFYLIGEFEDGTDYYATPEGETTTDITGIYLGVGNADGDIDLDIIEYAVEITSPLDSADIALDVPFTFEATTNVQDDRTLHIVAYQGELTVVLDELPISGGAISGSVTVSESDGFTTGAVQLLAWYSPVVSTIDTVDVTAHTATITNVTSTPASPEPATDFELSGDSTYLVGEELTLQYSTDDATWLPLGVATVQGDGTWSKDDCQIATAGSYYLRAIYGAEVVESESVSVTVESAIPSATLFVVSDATGSNDGTSWDNAYTDLQTAIDTAVSGQEVWVKQGTYYPSVAVGGRGEERDKAFYLKTGVTVYGGFSGADYIFANRNYIANETICHANGNYHVFNFKDKNCNRTAILDGFTVRGAYGNNTTDTRHRGGGFAFPTVQSHPTIRNCKITANYSIYGSAIRVFSIASPLFENCLIYDNGGDYAIIGDYLQAPIDKRFTLSGCKIYNTTLASKRCIQTWDGYADGITVEDCEFYNWNNYPVINLTRSGTTATQDNIINRCIFRDCYMALSLKRNSTANRNKVYNTLIKNCTYAIEGRDYGSEFNNCTITGNINALYNNNTTNYGYLNNCIIYGNTNMFARAGYNNFTFTYCDCQTAQGGTGNISSNPNWDANFNLNAGGPCVDTGDNTYAYGDSDLNGNTRIVNTTVDMGCYERQ